MDIQKPKEIQNLLDASDMPRNNFQRDLCNQADHLQENTRFSLAERESKPIPPLHSFPEENFISLKRVMSDEVRGLQEGRKYPPIPILPDELLVEIWSYARAPELHPDFVSIPFTHVASWVSSRWRIIALSTPILWRNVYISPYRSVELAKTQLERSQMCSINIWVTDYSVGHDIIIPGLNRRWQRSNEGRIDELVALAAAHVGRWYSLELNASGAKWLATILPPLRHAYAPQLRHLSIRFPGMRYLDPVFTGGTPCLRNVDLHNMSIPTNLHLLRELTHLDLRDIPSAGWASLVEWRSLLAACPGLITLSIHTRCFKSDDIDEDLHSPICVQSLRSLGLCFDDDEDDFISDFFQSFSAPELRCLELAELGPEAFESFMDAMTTCPPTSRWPRLSKLSLYTGDYDDTFVDDCNALQLFSLFPHIDNLALTCRDEVLSNVLEVLATCSATCEGRHEPGPLCPRLGTLTWNVWIAEEQPLLEMFIVRRANVGYPIKRFRVDSRYFREAGAETKEWFDAHLNVEVDDGRD